MDAARLTKLERLKAKGMLPYASRYERTHTLAQARALKDGKTLAVAGRIVLLRDMGKVTFLTLQDHTGRMQAMLREDDIGERSYRDALEVLDLGDIIGIKGTRFTTQKGEETALAAHWTMLSKALSPLPEKWHGLHDRETAERQRYLDLLSNRSTFDRFLLRSKFVRSLREFYWSKGFVEVDLPALVNAASGALATPFTTHHNALDLDVYLRIALETHQKECLIGGFDRTFSIGPVFRNEGMDPSHLQEFTMCEHYAAYWDYADNIRFTEEMVATLIKDVTGGTRVQIPNRAGELVSVDFAPPWPRVTVRDAIRESSGIDIDAHATADGLRAAMAAAKIRLDLDISVLGRGNLIDQLYKKVSRPGIVQPTFLIAHPTDLSPLARRNDANPAIVDRFQLVVGGWEIVNAYSELVDPVDQAGRFEQQASAGAGGDSDAHRKDDEFVEALSYGCPPCSGWGMGVDRFVALLTQQENLKDVVLFPLLKPFPPPQPLPQREKGATDPLSPPVGKGSGDRGHLLEHASYGHLLPAAHGLLEAHTDKTRAHLLATGAAMAALASRFGGDAATWRVAGMLHDLDWDKLDKDAEAHCSATLEELLASVKAPQELLADIRSHYAAKYGADYPLDTWLRKCLYCCDELTGFILAVARVRPSGKLADVEVKSVLKKLKEKSFAAQVDRAQIKRCEELLTIPLDEFVAIVLEAMRQAPELSS
ncbi:MAG: lysyl-tRNA synthetase, class II [Candidatus Peregrinibacteria bacterium Gr01-1014_25]|nr:MAG: lysyl-tRNA synthetase, class II [Candidatus Peregrinibacteria bacterium Gr01-1014_25]